MQGAAQTGQKGTQRKHRREQPGLVDAQRADHVTVLRGGAHQRAPARLSQQQPQQTQHHRARHNQKEVIRRKLPTQNRHRTGESGRAGPEQFFGAPEPQHQVLDDQAQRKGGQQLKQLRRAVNAAQQQHLNQSAQGCHSQRGQQQRRPKTNAGTQVGHQRISHVNTDHEKRTMGEIDDAGDAKNKRQTGGH